MRKILVLRGGALGDFIVTLPALAALRRTWPSARIELAGNATAAAIAHDSGLIDAVHSQQEARWSALFGPAPLPEELAAWLGSFDLVLNFWPDDDGALLRQFPLRPGQKFLSAPAHPTIAPAAAHYCAALTDVGIESRDFFYPLVTPHNRGRVDDSRAPIAIHPGSGSLKKNWPLERWAILCEWLEREHGAELLMVTGEAESAAARRLAPGAFTAHDLPLGELMARLAPCQLFVGHDSGISHLAAACGVPCVLLFGPTDPAVWAPPTPAVCIVRRSEKLDSISVDDLQRDLARLLAPPK